MTTRRAFLASAGALVAAMGIPVRRALADAGAADNGKKFVFVFNPGGWDPTRAFATEFGNANVDMEPDARPGLAGGITYVDHPARPAVHAFFENWHEQTAVLNGVLVPSIAHDVCTMITMTGDSTGASPDWPALLATEARDDYTLPCIVLDGPSFPGQFGVSVARTGTNGQLSALLSGRALEWSDTPVRAPSPPAEDLVDRYLSRRASARRDASQSLVETTLTADFATSLDRASSLKDLRYVMSFGGSGNTFADQSKIAVQALSIGVSRCVTIATPGGSAFAWDSHTQNDATQSPLWDGMFSGLSELLALLQATPGSASGKTLADETIVVVLSEMGRTPLLNGFSGKDHWPYTSAMLIGSGLRGSRVVGGFDDHYQGVGIDPATAGAGTEPLTSASIGATLLAAAGIDPSADVPHAPPITGLLA